MTKERFRVLNHVYRVNRFIRETQRLRYLHPATNAADSCRECDVIAADFSHTDWRKR